MLSEACKAEVESRYLQSPPTVPAAKPDQECGKEGTPTVLEQVVVVAGEDKGQGLGNSKQSLWPCLRAAQQPAPRPPAQGGRAGSGWSLSSRRPLVAGRQTKALELESER